MRSPSVFIRNGRYWLDYYVGGQRVRVSTNIPADRTDWHKSKHSLDVRDAINNADVFRNAPTLRPRSRTWTELFSEYVRVHNAERFKYSTNSLEPFRYAISFVEKEYGPDIGDLTRERAMLLRERSSVSDVTLRDYFARLRLLCDFAVRSGYLGENPFARILVRVKPKAPRIVSIEDEKAILRKVRTINPPAFPQLLFQRVTAFRVSEVCNLSWKQVHKDALTYINNKGSHETLLLTSFERYLLERFGEPGEFVFRYRTRTEPNYALSQASKQVLGYSIGTHQLKRSYAQEMNTGDVPLHILSQLSHHSTKSITINRYAGTPAKLLRDIREETLRHWHDFAVTVV